MLYVKFAFQKRFDTSTHFNHKMVKHTQTIRRLLPMNCLSVFDHMVGLTLEGLIEELSPEFNPFFATSFFLYPLKTENQRFYYIFRGYRKRPMAWNGFMSKSFPVVAEELLGYVWPFCGVGPFLVKLIC